MSAILQAIEIIAEETSAALGTLQVDPRDEDDDWAENRNMDWLYNGGLLQELLDLAETANQLAQLADRPAVRAYLQKAEYPASRRLRKLLARGFLVSREIPTIHHPPRPLGPTTHHLDYWPELEVPAPLLRLFRSTPCNRQILGGIFEMGTQVFTPYALAMRVATQGQNVGRQIRRLAAAGYLDVVRAPAGKGSRGEYRANGEFFALFPEQVFPQRT